MLPPTHSKRKRVNDAASYRVCLATESRPKKQNLTRSNKHEPERRTRTHRNHHRIIGKPWWPRTTSTAAPIPPQSSTRFQTRDDTPMVWWYFSHTLSTPTLNDPDYHGDTITKQIDTWTNETAWRIMWIAIIFYTTMLHNSTCWFGSIRSVVSSSGKTTKLLDKKNYKIYKNFRQKISSPKKKATIPARLHALETIHEFELPVVSCRDDRLLYIYRACRQLSQK